MREKSKQNYVLNHSSSFFMMELLSLYMCIYASGAIIGNTVFGAALFTCGFAVQNFFLLRRHKVVLYRQRLASASMAFIAMLSFALGGALLYIYPALTGNAGSLIVTAVALLLLFRSSLTYELLLRHSENRRRCAVLILLLNVSVTAMLYLFLGVAYNWTFALEFGAISFIHPAAVSIWIYRTRAEKLMIKAEYDAARVSSYTLYYALLLCSTVSLYLSIMSYAGLLVLMPAKNPLLLPVALWLVIAFSCTFVLGRLIRRSRLKDAEKNTLFLIGGILWLFSRAQLNESFILYSASMAWFWSLVQAIGLSLMMLLATYMQEDMKLVLELTDDVGEAAVITYRSLTQQVAFLIASVCITAELCFLSFALEGRIPLFSDLDTFRKGFMWILNLLPVAFVLLSMFFALYQPVNRDIVRKLKLYREQKASQTVNPAFEDRLMRLLVRRYRVRIGVKILAFLMKPWMYHKVIGAKTVDLSHGPVIFVANHREIYGPIISNLYLPFSFRPWIEHKMLDREKIAEHIWQGAFRFIKPAWFGKLALKITTPIVAWILNSVEPIPVYRGTARESIKTLNLSVEALQEQDNLLIFPEDPSKTENKRYALSGVSEFFPGFVHVAKSYYRATGNIAVFYPVYANPKKRTITFGEGVAYDPKGRNEPERISRTLMDAMNEMAQ
jgi:1-acyl-sn-glycerol-3-phosphate acyltransferase